MTHVAGSNIQGTLSGHRVSGVQEEIQDQLLDLAGVALENLELRIQIHVDRDFLAG